MTALVVACIEVVRSGRVDSCLVIFAFPFSSMYLGMRGQLMIAAVVQGYEYYYVWQVEPKQDILARCPFPRPKRGGIQIISRNILYEVAMLRTCTACLTSTKGKKNKNKSVTCKHYDVLILCARCYYPGAYISSPYGWSSWKGIETIHCAN